MTAPEIHFENLLNERENASIHVQTLGAFTLFRQGVRVSSKEWGREASIQLFQFFITKRHRHGLHKEQIINEIWGDADSKSGNQNFKVALHGVNKVLEPDKKSRQDAKYIIRQGLSYQLNREGIWIDAEAVDNFISLGNQVLADHPKLAKKAYYQAVELYQGLYLPNRLYDDWSTEERERIQLLSLGALISLSELLVKENPLESIRLAQQALQIDPTWEDAYRIQMEAYLEKGNRPMAIKTYQQCVKVLTEEFAIDPLPETKQLFSKIKSIG